MLAIKLFVVIVFKAASAPNKYAPLSPRKIFAFGKLNNKKTNKIIIWAIKIKENSKLLSLIFKYVKIKFMIIKLKVSNPLNPSMRFAPLIINKKHINTKIEENSLFLSK